MQSTLDALQQEARDEMTRLYKLASEANLAAAKHETKALALTLLALLDEHPEVTAVGFDVNHDYERRENRYYSMVDFLFWVGDEQIGDDWTYMSEELHGWSHDGADGLGEEGEQLTREDLRKVAGLDS